MSEHVIWNELGNVYMKLGAFDDAVSAYLKAIELDPGFGWSYSNLAFAHFKKGNFEEAIPLYIKSMDLLETDNDRAVAWNRLGDTYRQVQDYQTAFDAYKFADQILSHAAETQKEPDVTLPFSEPDREITDSDLAVDSHEGLEFPSPEATPELIPAGYSESPEKKIDGLPDWLTDPRDEVLWTPGMDGTEEPDNRESQIERFEKPAGSFSDWLRELLGVDAKKEAYALGTRDVPFRRNTFETPNQAESEKIQEDADRCPVSIPDANSRINALSPEPVLVEESGTTVKFKPFQTNSISDPSGLEIHKETQIANTSVKPNSPMQAATVIAPPRLNPPQQNDSLLAEVRRYERIISINAENDRAWDILGNLYKSSGRYDDAIRALHNSIQLAPHREDYHYHLGLVFTVQNRYLDAIESFQKAIGLDNDCILAHGALAGCYRRLGRDEEAVKHINIALPKMREESSYNQACFNAICGNTDLAIQLLKVSLSNQETSLEWVQSDPDLECLRNDPRYHGLIQEALQEMAVV